MVGTLTVYGPSAASRCPWYRREGVFHLGQLAVRTDLQRGGLGTRLMQAGEAKARELGASELALDTAEGAAHLRAWYERLGFVAVDFMKWDVTNYRSVVMSKRLTSESSIQDGSMAKLV